MTDLTTTSTVPHDAAVADVGPNEYVMTISRLTIDKLGIKLYDRVSAVLAELVANAYDADAEVVQVSVPFGKLLSSSDPASQNYEIVIQDDGHGMTRSEINEQYLKVGSDRRQRTGSDTSRLKHRPVMGRKGIGKLAPFGICRQVEVLSAGRTDGGRIEFAHLILNLDDMLLDSDTTYRPMIGPMDRTAAAETGTTITLRQFNRKRVPSKEELSRQLAARFGVARADWLVSVANSLDENDSFDVGELPIEVLEGTRLDVSEEDGVQTPDGPMPVTGWVAYSKSPYKDPAMAGVRIFARGKLVAQTRDFGIGAGFTGEFKLRSYLVGVIHAEWLDADEDLVRSDRQDIIWSSELGEALSVWGQSLMRKLAIAGEQSVRTRTWEDFLSKSGLEQRLKEQAPNDESFRTSVRAAARLLVKDKDREALKDEDHVKSIVQLAFALGPQRTLMEALREAAEPATNTLDTVIALFERASVAEMYSLGQVASERIQVVERLRGLIQDPSTLERPLQELIEGAPWLLSPEWTPLGMNETLQRVRSSFESWYNTRFNEPIATSTIGTPRREPDFVLLHDSGELRVVEIKRVNYHITGAEFDRAMNYLGRLEEFLDSNPVIGDQFKLRSLVIVADHIDKLGYSHRSSLANDRRIHHRTWRELLDSTVRAHQDFLTRVEAMQHGPTGEL